MDYLIPLATLEDEFAYRVVELRRRLASSRTRVERLEAEMREARAELARIRSELAELDEVGAALFTFARPRFGSDPVGADAPEPA